MAFAYQRLAGGSTGLDERAESSSTRNGPTKASTSSRISKSHVLAVTALLLALVLTSTYAWDNLPSISALGSSSAKETRFLSLEERLQNLEARPILSYNDMVTLSLQGCPEGIYRREAQAHFSEWKSMDDGRVKSTRDAMVLHLRSLRQDQLVYNASRGRRKTRGIVMAGGNAHTLERLEASIRYLREAVQTDLPIQLFHFADEMQNPADRSRLERYNVQVIQIEEKHGAARRQYSIKPKAFIASTFDEFAYFDADSIPLQRLEQFFESAEYRTYGSVFYPDLSKDNPKNPIWRVLGQACSNEWWTAESGQLLFDKTANNGLNLAVLQLALYMTDHPESFELLGWGDKDAYRYSFFALGLPYSQAPRAYSTLGSYRNSSGQNVDYFNGHSMLQWGLTPWEERHNPKYRQVPGMIHSNQLKHFRSLDPEKVFVAVQQPFNDGITDDSMARILYTHHWPALYLDLTLIGPDGRVNATNSYGDGQAILVRDFQDVMGHDPRIYQEVIKFGRVLASLQAEEVN